MALESGRLAVRKASAIAFPMHGQQKMVREGYRTRDAHLIEWIGRHLLEVGPLAVISRPEPHWLRPLAREGRATGRVAANTTPTESFSWKLPDITNRRRWWVQSLSSYSTPDVAPDAPAIVWNPMVSTSNLADQIFNGTRRVHADLLDDWSIHYAFSSIKADVERAYGRLFERADTVTANSEGTVELAERFGRSDVVLVPNGCDPERFSEESVASGRLTVGYVGKIGNRLDLELIAAVSSLLPEVSFVFAGPILDSAYRSPLEKLPNVQLLGDVHYDDVPALLQSFDVGWVPHRVGEFEVGGDVLKTYEYRAAGLVVLSTPVAGAGDRGLDAVHVLPAELHPDWIRSQLVAGTRVGRVHQEFPSSSTWKGKSEFILRQVGMN